jgi:hypothetical protein
LLLFASFVLIKPGLVVKIVVFEAATSEQQPRPVLQNSALKGSAFQS